MLLMLFQLVVKLSVNNGVCISSFSAYCCVFVLQLSSVTTQMEEQRLTMEKTHSEEMEKLLQNVIIIFRVSPSASEMTYIVSGGALNSTHSLPCVATYRCHFATVLIQRTN